MHYFHSTSFSGTSGAFPFVWLRDNSHDSETFHLTDHLKARNIAYDKFKYDIVPADLSINTGANQVEIHWTGGLKSVYTSEWLLERNFTDPSHANIRKIVQKFT